MTSPDPYPEVKSRLEIGALPGRSWIECVNCIEHQWMNAKGAVEGPGEDPVTQDPDEWALEHNAKYPTHTRYRTVSQTNFRVVPSVQPERTT
ncbi:DUF7848 domain-containing protein [Streptomyces hyaluromycini]|uniref:DUF7848 domain-containing protein n=1 Tax=Streptomyces hyaluromycini TaxID=1377993 RepID=UPI000B5C5DD8|nr:hypothetical protein [Streptomyces hyaluromycini]